MEGSLASRELPYPDCFYFTLFKVNSPCSAFCPAFFDVQWFIIEIGGTLAWEGKGCSSMYSSFFQGRRVKKKPFEQRELIFTVSEIARTLGLSEMSIYRYRRDFGSEFPKLPTFKGGIRNWARHRVPFKRGPLPSEIRRVVVRMREQGKTFRQIGKALRISHQAAHQHWKRHLKQ